MSCQNQQTHPFTGAAPGGWGWTDLSGAVPDADDTPRSITCPKKNKPTECTRGRAGKNPNLQNSAIRRTRSRLVNQLTKQRQRLAHILSRLVKASLRPKRHGPHSSRNSKFSLLGATILATQKTVKPRSTVRLKRDLNI